MQKTCAFAWALDRRKIQVSWWLKKGRGPLSPCAPEQCIQECRPCQPCSWASRCSALEVSMLHGPGHSRSFYDLSISSWNILHVADTFFQSVLPSFPFFNQMLYPSVVQWCSIKHRTSLRRTNQIVGRADSHLGWFSWLWKQLKSGTTLVLLETSYLTHGPSASQAQKSLASPYCSQQAHWFTDLSKAIDGHSVCTLRAHTSKAEVCNSNHFNLQEAQIRSGFGGQNHASSKDGRRVTTQKKRYLRFWPMALHIIQHINSR